MIMADDRIYAVLLQPGRIGWYSTVQWQYANGIPMETFLGWWRPTREGALKVADRYVRRQKARRVRAARLEVILRGDED